MCYVLCCLSRGWVNQWNNSITLGNCTIWVLNNSLVKLNPPFVCNQLQHAIFSLVQLNYAYCCHTIGPICFVLPGVAHLIQFTFKNAGQCMCYVACLGGWVNQWNNSITLGTCTIWVLNISLVKLNPPFVCNQLQPAIFSLLWYGWTMHCNATQSIPIILCVLLLPILFSSRLKMLDRHVLYCLSRGGELTSEITPWRWETAQSECWI